MPQIMPVIHATTAAATARRSVFGKASPIKLGYAAVQRIARAEIAAQRAGDIAPELHIDRLVKAKLPRHALYSFKLGVFAHHGHYRVTGNDAQHDEYQKCNAQHHKNSL